MPITKSAKKALLVSERRKEENSHVKANIKNALKGARISIREQDGNLPEKISLAYRALDLAAKKNVIHPNKVARLKSRLTLAASKEKAEKVAKPAKKKKTK